MEDKSRDEEQFIKWLEDKLSSEERKKFESSEDYMYYSKIMNETEGWSLDQVNAGNSFDQLMERKGKASQKTKMVKMRPLWYGIAATVTLLIGYFAYTFITNQATVHRTGIGEIASIELPDGSVVHLNAQSEISFRRKKWDRKRKIALSGNAYFDVAKGGSFEVSSPQGLVVVTGTEFEILDSDDYYKVECLEGSVEVELFDSPTKELLKAGDIISSTRKKVHRSKTTRGKHRSWENGKTTFENAPLSQVFKAIENQFGVTIDVSLIKADRKFTGEFLHNNLEIALKMVCIPMQIEYELSGDKVVLKHAK